MKPLRAFLFSRSVDGNWSVTVFRDWEPLEAEIKLGDELDRSCLFLHIGFWRPETLEISQLGDAWLGRVLISQAAIHALPNTTSVSVAPVQHIGKLPVHVCLSGYGYEISDPTNVVQVSANSFLPTVPAAPRSPNITSLIESFRANRATNWVEWTILQRQDLAGYIGQASIANDEDFLAKEYCISDPRIRHELAMIRFRILTGEKPDPTDFVDKVHATPYWFLDLPLSNLNLNVRQRNVFTGHGLQTIQDVALKGSVGLLKLPNMGRKSLFDLGKVMIQAFEEGIGLSDFGRGRGESSTAGKLTATTSTARNQTEDRTPSPLLKFDSFSDGINSAVKKIKIEDRGVWAARIGYKCQRQTLQQIAETVGLTRERIRQLVSKVFRQVGKSPFWEQLSERLDQMLHGRETPLLVGGLSAIDPWFDSDIAFETPLKEICKALFAGRYSVFQVRDVAILTKLSHDDWENAVGSAKSALESIVGTDVNESQAKSIIYGLLPDKGGELRNDLWHEVTLEAKWSGLIQGERILVGFGNDIETVILTVLNGAETPLHTSEITKKLRSFDIANHDENYVRNAAQKVALLFHRGTYGLSKHVPLTHEQMSLIRSEVESIISEGEPTRQWHTSELFELLQERGLDFDDKLSKYLINIALKDSTILSYLRRMVWGLSEHWENKSTERLDVRQAIISLLESEGSPMSAVEIRSRLTEERGVGTHFQIHSVTPIVRIGPAVFGLDYRDIDYGKVHPLVDKLKDVLRHKKSGLHVSEVPDALGLTGDDAETIAGTVIMVGQRHGLKQDRAQYVFPEEWQFARRYSIGSAFLQAIKETRGIAVSSNQICKRVCELTQRTILQNSISHMLREQNYKWDESTGLWSEDIDQDDEE
jgi:hypothetical protein